MNQAKMMIVPLLAAAGGCMVGPEKFADIDVCESCRRAKLRWLAAHPLRVPSF